MLTARARAGQNEPARGYCSAIRPAEERDQPPATNRRRQPALSRNFGPNRRPVIVAVESAPRECSTFRRCRRSDSSYARQRRHPPSTLADIAASEAILGRRDKAPALLENAVSKGWFAYDGLSYRLDEVPGLMDLRGDPRFERLVRITNERRARERRETEALGSSRCKKGAAAVGNGAAPSRKFKRQLLPLDPSISLSRLSERSLSRSISPWSDAPCPCSAKPDSGFPPC